MPFLYQHGKMRSFSVYPPNRLAKQVGKRWVRRNLKKGQKLLLQDNRAPNGTSLHNNKQAQRYGTPNNPKPDFVFHIV